MNERTTAILAFHATKSFGSKANLERQQQRVAELYRSLQPEEATELIRFVIQGTHPTAADESDMILRFLACLRPGSLDGHHKALIEKGVLNPPVIYHGAGQAIARRLVDLMPGEKTDHLLCALAWVGGEVVETAFRTWRDQPPEWVDDLHIPPDRYSFQAGWALSADGRRRDLITPKCHTLVPPHDQPSDAKGVRVVDDHEGTCGWCGRNLATLLDLDLKSFQLPLVSPSRGRLRIATCEVCSCSATVFTKVGEDGSSAWHESNPRPDYLPDPSEEWNRLPRGCLVLGSQTRPPVESADWLVPGVRFSQIGGHPTWVQDAEYPACPGCQQPMPFIGQLSNEDYEDYGEGIYYLFACGRCGVAATSYQQS
jgi:hypothetical protein